MLGSMPPSHTFRNSTLSVLKLCMNNNFSSFFDMRKKYTYKYWRNSSNFHIGNWNWKIFKITSSPVASTRQLDFIDRGLHKYSKISPSESLPICTAKRYLLLEASGSTWYEIRISFVMNLRGRRKMCFGISSVKNIKAWVTVLRRYQ